MTIPICMENLSFTYKGQKKPAIKNIDLRITDGEYIVVAGPTGCGKTTLCRCFNGLIPHFHQGKMTGRIEINGLDVSQTRVSELAQAVGFVFQDPENQLVAFNAERELAFAPENLGLPPDEIRKRVEEAIEMVGINHLRAKAPYELSGGEQQRVAIASVLTLKPRILVLDEPTSNLDPVGAKRVVDLLRQINRTYGITVIVIEHRLDLVAPHSSRILVMNDGKIVIDGEPRTVLSSDYAEEIGVGIPKILKLFKNLGLEGGTCDLPLTPEEAARMLT